MITSLFHSLELWVLDLFIGLLSHPTVVRFWRAQYASAPFSRVIFFYSVIFSVFGLMGFLSGYIFIVLQMFGSR